MKINCIILALIVLLTAIQLAAQEKKCLHGAPSRLTKSYETKLKQTVKSHLLSFAQSPTQNPELFLDTVVPFYLQTCQSQEHRTLMAYARMFCLNRQKVFAYLQLMRAVNQRVYQPHIDTVIARMSKSLDPQHMEPEESKKMQDVQMEYLAHPADHPALEKEAQEIFKQEWAHTSVSMDLEAHAQQLQDIKNLLESDKAKLSLSEQNDCSLENLGKKIERYINTLTRAAHLINGRNQIKELITDMPAFILNHITNQDLKEKINEYKEFMPVERMNEIFKSHHPEGYGLLHFICQKEDLSHAQKEYAIRILEEEGLHINDHNFRNKTPLDLVAADNTDLAQLLIELGGQHSLKKITSLKKSYDSPPSSPDQASREPLKRSVTFKLDYKPLK